MSEEKSGNQKCHDLIGAAKDHVETDERHEHLSSENKRLTQEIEKLNSEIIRIKCILVAEESHREELQDHNYYLRQKIKKLAKASKLNGAKKLKKIKKQLKKIICQI